MELQLKRAKVKQSTAGQTLIDVMVGTGLIAVAFLAIMQVNRHFAAVSLSSAMSIEYGSLISRIHSMIATEQACRLTLGGPTSVGGGAVSETQVYSSSTTNYKLYVPEPASPRTVFIDPSSSAKKKFGNWKVEKISLQPQGSLPSFPASFPAKMVVQVAGPSSEVRTRVVEFGITLKVNGSGQIESCSRLSYENDIPVQVCPPGQAPRSNGTGMTCGSL